MNMNQKKASMFSGIKLAQINAALTERLGLTATTAREELAALTVSLSMDPEMQAEYVAVPLWQLFGYEEVSFGGDSGRPALPNWIDFMKSNDVEGYLEAWHSVMKTAENQYGLPVGKGDKGFRQIDGSKVFDLGKHQWRLVDLLRSPTMRPENPYVFHLDIASTSFTAKDTDLGDGTWAWVRPSTIGYEGLVGNEETLLQAKGFIWSDDGVCRKVFKGLVKVTNAISRDYLSVPSGYGPLEVEYGMDVEIHPMTDVKYYNPAPGRLGDQRGSYDGITDWGDDKMNWWDAMRPGMTLRLMEGTDGAKMVQAGANIGQLPLTDRIQIASLAFRSAFEIPMGVRRKVSPGLDLKPFTFRAPKGCRGQFIVGKKYVITRDPALPDGTSSWSGECVGFTAGNFFEVPTNASPAAFGAEYGTWEQMGGDFDGDDALVVPHHTDGGLILGFNDRSQAEQDALKAAAGAAGRKGANFKRDYESGNLRWAHARIAVVMLGMYDFAARKAIDETPGLAGKLLAARLKPAIQWAVDRQKRDLIAPEIPSFVAKQTGDYLMQFMKALRKPKIDNYEEVDKTSIRYQWDLLQAQVSTAEQLVAGGMKAQPGKLKAVQVNVKWALGIHASIMRQSPLEVEDRNTGKFYPKVSNFPDRDIAAYLELERSRMTEIMDASELFELEDQIVQARRRGRSNLARSAERLLGDWMQAQDFFDQLELSAQISDPQLWIKVAPIEQVRSFWAGGHTKKFQAAHELPGVVVPGIGRQWVRVVGGRREMKNSSEMQFSGLTVDAGQMVVRQEGTDVVLALAGFDIARTPGSIGQIDRLMAALQMNAGKLASILPERLEDMI